MPGLESADILELPFDDGKCNPELPIGGTCPDPALFVRVKLYIPPDSGGMA